MRKVKIEIELELPDEYDNWSVWEIEEIVNDEYVHKPASTHAMELCEWTAKKAENPDIQNQNELIAELHREWWHITRGLKANITVEKK